MKNESKIMIALQVSRELYDKLKEDANKKELTLSALIRLILLEYYK